MRYVVRGKHRYETIEGNEDFPTKIRITRVDKGLIDPDSDEIMEKLERVFYFENDSLVRLASQSEEEMIVRITLTTTESQRRGGGLGLPIRIPRSEVERHLQQIPNE